MPMAKPEGILRCRRKIITGRLSTARNKANADGSRIGAAPLRPYTTTTRHASMKRNLAPGFCSILSKIMKRSWSGPCG